VPGSADKPMIGVKFRGEEKQFSAEEISSMILNKMKETFLPCCFAHLMWCSECWEVGGAVEAAMKTVVGGRSARWRGASGKRGGHLPPPPATTRSGNNISSPAGESMLLPLSS